MKFGVRQICNVVFKAKVAHKIGNVLFRAGQPVLLIDTATTSTLSGESTTVYAQGGRGNARLIAWEGERTLTFEVEDALLSPMGFALLSGAGVIHDDYDTGRHSAQHVHSTATVQMDKDGVINLDEVLGTGEQVAKDAPVFVIVAEADGSLSGELLDGFAIANNGRSLTGGPKNASSMVFVDFYVEKSTHVLHELQIDAENFAGYYYVEADTLFRDQATGRDLPATITLPNVKIQSNFTFTMSSTGDPSTFTFTMDAFPGYTMFDRSKKVLCVIQIINETLAEAEANRHTVMPRQDSVMKDYDNNEYDDSTAVGPVAGAAINDYPDTNTLAQNIKADPVYQAQHPTPVTQSTTGGTATGK